MDFDIDALVNSVVDGGSTPQPVNQGKGQPPAGVPADAGKGKEPENAEIRLEKMRKQRDEARATLATLTSEFGNLGERLARLEGKTDVLTSQTPDEEATLLEEMSDTERMLYKQNKQLQQTMALMGQKFEGLEVGSKRERILSDEAKFFEKNASIDREDVKDTLKEYFADRPDLAKVFQSGELSLEDAYVLATKTKPVASGDPTSIFGDGKPEGAVPGPGVENAQPSEAWNIINKELRSPTSEKKRVAIDAGLSLLTDEIITQGSD